jgi:hypothetical protein
MNTTDRGDFTPSPRRFRKRPVEIEAVQFTRDNGTIVAKWCGGRWTYEAKPSDPSDVAEWVLIPTLEGQMQASLGDWIIRGVQGEFYPCKPDIFAATYEVVDP